MTPVTAAKVKYGVWGLIGGALIAMIIGFVWGGWTTSGTTARMGEEAVLAARAAICVAQFMQQPNPQEKLQELEKVYSYDRAKPTVSPLMIPLVYCYINSFQRASSVEKPLPGGEKRIDGWAAHPVAW